MHSKRFADFSFRKYFNLLGMQWPKQLENKAFYECFRVNGIFILLNIENSSHAPKLISHLHDKVLTQEMKTTTFFLIY